MPWDKLTVERYRKRFSNVAELRIDDNDGSLSLCGFVANRLVRAVPRSWPEAGPFLPDTKLKAASVALAHWAIGMLFIFAFFGAASEFARDHPPVPVEALELFGALFGLAAVREFVARTKA